MVLELSLFVFAFFWCLRETKAILFWLYLWQIKEYHLGRFIDHFRTEKGRKIFLNKIIFLKILLLSLFIFLVAWQPYLFFLLFLLYFFEGLKLLFDFSQKRILKPIFTKKTSSLAFLAFLFLAFYLFVFFKTEISLLVSLLIFDIFTPFIVSGLVLFFQPLAFFWRSNVIQKAIKKREKFKDLLVVGITGSYGKTSTKEFLATILSEKFKVLKTKEHQNSEIGISQCILKELKPEHQIFIVEMGAYNKGGIKLLAKIAKPQIAILTGVNQQHLALFGSMENLISAEGGKELIESLPEDGLVIFNGENETLGEIYKKTEKRKKIVGIEKKDFDLWAENIKVEREKISFRVFFKTKEKMDLSLGLIGVQNVQNLLLAICCAKEQRMTLEEISRAIEKISQEQSGVRLLKTKDGLNIVDATYSMNPDSVISHLEYLKVWPGKKVLVMPCLIELGKASKEVHRKIGKKIYEVCDLAIIATKDRFEEIKKGAKEKAIFLEDPVKIFVTIKQFNRENDVILFEGRLPKEFLNLVYGN